ncbi:DUF4871 domain-containing protein [Paenibacillus sp. GCM10027626]|uniref:DUF4871 domain-containing protein n=1 Tax=Paenibacillus sp. GCM10027626 TaxID=3273411 RepID=UPI00363371E1
MPQEHEEYLGRQLKDSPFSRPHFTDAMKNNVLVRANAGQRNRSRTPRYRLIAAASVLIVVAAAAIFGWNSIAPQAGKHGSFVEERQSYYEEGKLKLSVLPDPSLRAGSKFRYIFHLTAPFAELKDRTLAISAEHIETGHLEQIVAAEKITSPISGYQGLERYTAFAALPLSGYWRYTITVDGQFYGDAVLHVPDASWQASPLFKYETYTLRGTEGTIGLIDGGLVAGSSQKVMWHIWEKETPLERDFVVKAVKQGETQIIDVFTGSLTDKEQPQGPRRAISSIALPEPGLWRLLPYAGDQLLDSITVEVKDGS